MQGYDEGDDDDTNYQVADELYDLFSVTAKKLKHLTTGRRFTEKGKLRRDKQLQLRRQGLGQEQPEQAGVHRRAQKEDELLCLRREGTLARRRWVPWTAA